MSRLPVEQAPVAKILVVDAESSKQRLDVWLAKTLVATSRSSIRKLIDCGAVFVNGRPGLPRTLVQEGDEISIVPVVSAQAPSQSDEGSRGSLPAVDVLFEDDYLVIINKPSGIAVHPGGDASSLTMVDWLIHRCPEIGAARGEFPDPERPGVVHRLDKDTTGSLVLAKTAAAHLHLAEQFRSKSNLREYLALLDGVPPWQRLTYASYISRHPTNRLQIISYSEQEAARIVSSNPRRSLRFAQSHFVVEQVFGHRLALARVTLATGRTHQIRVHAKALGFPVWGDPVYNRPKALSRVFPPEVRSLVEKASRQMLHAERLSIVHPVNGEVVEVRAPLPGDFGAILQALAPFGSPLFSKV